MINWNKPVKFVESWDDREVLLVEQLDNVDPIYLITYKITNGPNNIRIAVNKKGIHVGSPINTPILENVPERYYEIVSAQTFSEKEADEALKYMRTVGCDLFVKRRIKK